MSNRVKLYLMILGIPVAAILVANFAQAEFNQQWRAVLTEAFGEAVANHPENALVRTCVRAGDVSEMAAICRDMRLTSLLRLGGIGTIFVGGLYLLVVSGMGRMAVRDRSLLLKLFRPGAYVTVGLVILLVITQAALVLGGTWYLSLAIGFLSARMLMVMVGAVVAALAGVFAIGRGALAMVRDPVSPEPGKILSREDYPALWAFTDSIAYRLGTSPPDHIVAGLQPNFYVTEIDTECLDGRFKGRTMYLSLPLCHILSKTELRAIIGHELGHFRGEDTHFSRKFYPIYRGITDALANTLRNVPILMMPAAYALGYFHDAFATAEASISRERELVADRAGAEVAGARALGSALLKLHAFIDLWGEVVEEMADRVRHNQLLPNASTHYVEAVRRRSTPAALAEVDSQHLPHPVDSHPPLHQRLESLRLRREELLELALMTEPEDAAIQLLGDVTALEEALTRVEHKIIYHLTQPEAEGVA